MPRAPRADEAGGLYHALNRGNLRADVFRKDADVAAFERILHEGLQIHQVELYSYQLRFSVAMATAAGTRSKTSVAVAASTTAELG